MKLLANSDDIKGGSIIDALISIARTEDNSSILPPKKMKIAKVACKKFDQAERSVSACWSFQDSTDALAEPACGADSRVQVDPARFQVAYQRITSTA